MLKELLGKNLGANALMVFLYYGLYHDQKSGRIHKRPYSKITDFFGMPRTSAYAAVGELDEEGLYEPKPNTGPEGVMPAWTKVYKFVKSVPLFLSE